MDPISLPALSLGEGNSSGRSELTADLQVIQDAINMMAGSSQVPVAKSANYAAASGDVVLADASSSGFTVTLPAPVSGALVTVKKVDATTNVVTVAPHAAERIDGVATNDTLATPKQSHSYISDGTDWWLI